MPERRCRSETGWIDPEQKSSDFSTQVRAGWYDWFCSEQALAGRLKKIGRVVMGVTEPFILDNYYVWFKNNCPACGPLYDDARFEPLSGKRDGKYFIVCKDSPHEEAKWVLYTERSGFDTPEYESGNVRELTNYIKDLGRELAQTERLPAIPEQEAAPKKRKEAVR